MGRPRSFDERQLIASATALFIRLGYCATSIDDLVAETGVHRGSLYKAFGSKRGVFLASLRHLVRDELPSTPTDAPELLAHATLDLLLVAALELAPHDEDVRDLVDSACGVLAGVLPGGDSSAPATLLGRRLLERARAARPLP